MKKPLSSVEEYDPLSDTWTTKASMQTSRYYLGVVAGSNGKIYAIGGYGASSAVEEYDPSTDTWTFKASLLTPRWGLGLALVNGKIYATGGTDGRIEEYDPLTDTWTVKTVSPIGTFASGVTAASNGKIYVIGGMYSNQVAEYDPFLDTWKVKATMPTARSFLGVTSGNNGRVYAIGGNIEDSWYNKVEEYTPSDWESIIVNGNSQWVDGFHYRASYDFSTLNPRGDYFISIQNSIDSDNMLIAEDTRTTFILDYAGEISDTTPPSQPHVLAWGNGSLTQLSAQAYAKDPDSLIVGYRYAIGSSPGSVDVVNWTNISQNQVTHTGLTLLPDQAYFVSFQARNEGGLWSPVGVSNPVINGAELERLFLPLITR